jgi:hypothetical protein
MCEFMQFADQKNNKVKKSNDYRFFLRCISFIKFKWSQKREAQLSMTKNTPKTIPGT